MQTDIYLVSGLVLAALGIPSFLNAFSQSRFPRMAVLLFLVAAVLIVLAVNSHPGGYAIDDIPDAFIRVIAYVVN